MVDTVYKVRKTNDGYTIHVPDNVNNKLFEVRYDVLTGILTYYPIRSSAPVERAVVETFLEPETQ